MGSLSPEPTEVPLGPLHAHPKGQTLQLAPGLCQSQNEIHTLTWKTQVATECMGWVFNLGFSHHLVFLYICLHPETLHGPHVESDFSRIDIKGKK